MPDLLHGIVEMYISATLVALAVLELAFRMSPHSFGQGLVIASTINVLIGVGVLIGRATASP
jgi:hypothetical protein